MKMKFLPVLGVVCGALALTSCSSVFHTSSIVPVQTSVCSQSTAELQVSQQKISYRYIPTGSVKRTGEKGVISTAVAEALKANGNADVLMAFEYEMKKSTNLFGHKSIKYVIVEGYPAKYVNITPMKPLPPVACPNKNMPQ